MTIKKKLGIIGGMGSRAGSIFFQKIIDYSPAFKDQDFLEILFHNNSKVPDRTKAIIYNEESPLDEVYKSLDLFNSNHVEVIAISCITSYFYYNHFINRTSAKVMNPLTSIAEHVKTCYPNAKRVGLLATTGTIMSGLFHQELNKYGIEVITLDSESQENTFMRAIYMKNGFKSASISNLAKKLMKASVEKLNDRGIDLIIGGCTEVSIGINPKKILCPYIDVLDLFAQETVMECYGLNIKTLRTE